MEYKYTVYHDGEEKERRWMGNTSKTIKDPVTIEIKIELDKTRYDKIKAKYKTPIGEKILKIFE